MCHLRRRVDSMKNFSASACVIWLASAKGASSSGTSPKSARTCLAISAMRSGRRPAVRQWETAWTCHSSLFSHGQSAPGEMNRLIDETFGQPW